jgi:hypothetical protein
VFDSEIHAMLVLQGLGELKQFQMNIQRGVHRPLLDLLVYKELLEHQRRIRW